MGSGVFWAVTGGFLCGVALRSLEPAGLAFAALAALLSAAFFGLSLIERNARAPVIAAATCVAFSFGVARMDAATLRGDPALDAFLGKTVTVIGTVKGEPDARDTSVQVTLAVTSVGDRTAVRAYAKVLAILPAHADVSYGDEVRVRGTLSLPQSFSAGGGRSFDYPSYLASRGIGYEMQPAQADRTGRNVGNPVVASVIALKNAYIGSLDSVLPEPEASLGGGITVGDKRSIGPLLTNEFQRDSLVHMVVLSGYNITVVLNALARFTAFLPRYVRFGGSFGVVTFFVLLSGGAGSAVRAALMALIAVLARETHRLYLVERVLVSAAVAMIMYDPFTLIFDPSFQLSALATLGLIFFTPFFSQLFARVPERYALRDILASTAATQLTVLPLLLYQNGTLSLVALPANLLALLPVPWAMLFSFLAGIGGMLFPPLGLTLAFPAYALLWYIVSVAHLFASLPFAAVPVPAFSGLGLALAYLFLWLLWCALQKKWPEQAPAAISR